MKGIAAHTVSEDFRIDLGPPGAGAFQRFQDKHAAAFADHESIAVPVKGPGGFLRIIVAGGKGLHGVETGDAAW